MPTSGPNYAGLADEAAAGGIAWGSLSRAEGAPNGLTASAPGAGDTDWLVLTTYGFSIPGGETITAVAVTATARDATSASPVFLAQLVKGGVGVGDEQDLGGVTSTLSDVTASGVIGAGFWNTTLTPAEANASDFGVRVRFEGLLAGNTASVDAVGITITYGSGGGGSQATQRTLRNVG